MTDHRVLPLPDLDSQHYWEALANGRLELQHCQDCGHWTWPARPICSFCQGTDLEWKPARGTGQVHSWIVTHNVYSPAFAKLVPYTTVLVRLDEQDDILIPGRLLSDVEVKQGLKVRAAPEKLTNQVGELTWAAV